MSHADGVADSCDRTTCLLRVTNGRSIVILSDQQKLALQYLASGSHTAKEIGAHVKAKSVKSMLQSLSDQGYIRYSGNGARRFSDGMWALTQRGIEASKEP